MRPYGSLRPLAGPPERPLTGPGACDRITAVTHIVVMQVPHLVIQDRFSVMVDWDGLLVPFFGRISRESWQWYTHSPI